MLQLPNIDGILTTSRPTIVSMRFRDSATIRITRSLAFGAGIALVAASCGGSTESGIEELIEQQGGGDVDLDLDRDGGFSIQTEEGGMTIDEDGNFVITGEDGEVITGNADDEGNFTVESEDGTITGSEDDDGNFTIESEDGTITGSEEDGEFSVEGEDGSLTISSGEEMPSEWPSDIPQPDDFLIATSSVIGTGDDILIGLVGETSQDVADFVEDYGDALISAGFEQASSFESDGSILRLYTNDTWDVSVTAFEGIEGEPQISINLIQSS
jgi:flagellar basal body rod protein FlgG